MALYTKLLPICSLLVLGACAYATESSNQNILFTTPKAQGANCFAYVDKLKYKIHPPQKINIKKSPNAMEVMCDAPGNRHVKIEVPSQKSKKSKWGTPVGMAWDYASDSLYYYPSIITIDFSQEKLKPNELPQHNNSDIIQPEEYNLEEFRATQPRLNSDRYRVDQPILRRGETYLEEYIGDGIDENSVSKSGDKGDLTAVINDLTDNVASDAPAKIYAGE